MTSHKAKWFDTPSSGFGYAGKFYLKVFQSLQQSESMSLDSELPPMKTSWFLTDKTFEQWMSLVGYQSEAPQAFTFSAPAGVWALMQVLKDLGIKFSRIMHMSSQLKLLNKAGFKRQQHYSTYVHYLGARPHSSRAVLIRFQSVVKDVTGADIMTLEDELYVSGLDEAFVPSLNLDNETSTKRVSRAMLINNAHADQIDCRIERNLGQKYGKLSGDLNPLHISSIGARLFGHKTSFVQGLCTLNLIIGHLGRHWHDSVRSIDIHFIRPVAQPSQPKLYCTLDHFELVDGNQRLLVNGTYECG